MRCASSLLSHDGQHYRYLALVRAAFPSCLEKIHHIQVCVCLFVTYVSRLFDQGFSKHNTRLRCGAASHSAAQGYAVLAPALSRVRAMFKKWKLTPVLRGTAVADWPAKKACLRPHEMKAWPARDHKAPPRFTIFAVRVAVSVQRTRQVPENITMEDYSATE